MNKFEDFRCVGWFIGFLAVWGPAYLYLIFRHRRSMRKLDEAVEHWKKINGME